MAKSSSNLLLWGAGAAAAYYLYKNKDTLLKDATVTPPVETQPTGVVANPVPSSSTPLLASPPSITPTYTAAVQTPWGPVIPSNFNQTATNAPSVGGPVGACMQKKPNWTQTQCSDRLSQLVSAYNNAKSQIAFLQSQLASVPATVDVSDGEAELAKYQAAIATQAGVLARTDIDAVTRSNYEKSLASLQQGVSEIQARIAAKKANNPRAAIQQSIANWQAAADGHRNDYYSFTGTWL